MIFIDGNSEAESSEYLAGSFGMSVDWFLCWMLWMREQPSTASNFSGHFECPAQGIQQQNQLIQLWINCHWAFFSDNVPWLKYTYSLWKDWSNQLWQAWDKNLGWHCKVSQWAFGWPVMQTCTWQHWHWNFVAQWWWTSSIMLMLACQCVNVSFHKHLYLSRALCYKVKHCR